MQLRPITYRSEIISPVLTSLAAGECCSVIGMSGVGKSNMVQHMLRPDVLAHYLGEQAEHFRFVTLDANLLAEWSAWGFFEGLYAALLAVYESELPSDVIPRVRSTHAQLLTHTDHYAVALRGCAELLGLLCQDRQLVLILDEFDPLFSALPEQVFRNLRGLRDCHKYRLMYLTFSRQLLPLLRDDDDWDVIEPFVELLSLRELGLHPLRYVDALDEVQRFAQRHQQLLDTTAAETIAEVSGGHPALLRALVQQELVTPGTIKAKQAELHLQPTIRLECAKIVQQLTGDEQEALLQVAGGLPIDDAHTRILLLKGLFCQQNEKIAIFSPILLTYLKTLDQTRHSGGETPLVVDGAKHTIFYYGRDITAELTPRERRVLAYLWEHKDQICTVIEVARVVEPRLPDDIAEDIELEFCRVMMRRLRMRLLHLAPDRLVPLLIYRKLGYKLVTSFGADTA